jgi:hypothetical protein
MLVCLRLQEIAFSIRGLVLLLALVVQPVDRVTSFLPFEGKGGSCSSIVA